MVEDMNHDEAIKLEATERYLLDEMEQDERDSFEDHYFDCPVCANDVKSALALGDAVRAVGMPETKRVVVRPERFEWRRLTAPLAAAASVVVTFLTMNMRVVAPLKAQLASLTQIGVPQRHTFDETRGADDFVFEGRSTFELDVRIAPADVAPRYDWAIYDAQGKVQKQGSVSDEQVGEELRFPINVPAGTLKAGQFTLRIHGRREYTSSFTVR